jgi:hypothetical protein
MGKPKNVAEAIAANVAGDKHFKELQQQKKLLAQLAEARKDRDKALKLLSSQEEFRREIVDGVTALEPYPEFHYHPAKVKNLLVVPMLKLSDWHIGEKIDSNSTEGFGRYNYAIARSRIRQIVEDFLQWVEINRHLYVIETCAVSCEGDFVSGNIHKELEVTNEFPLPQQTVRAGQLLADVFHIIAPHFKRVDIYELLVDNHSRLTLKPQAKQGGENSIQYAMYAVTNALVANIGNLKIRQEALSILANVNGKKFLIEHGHNIRGQMGIPYYGMQRKVGREAVRRMNTRKHFDYLSIGHFHVEALIEGRVIVNASLSGTSEYDHSLGRMAEPGQVAFFVHPKYGIFNLTTFRGKV